MAKFVTIFINSAKIRLNLEQVTEVVEENNSLALRFSHGEWQQIPEEAMASVLGALVHYNMQAGS